MLYSLSYTSRAILDFQKEDLLSLLSQSRAKNSSLNITGLLLYGDGIFIQILEGNKEDVMNLYTDINDDPRHINIVTIYQKQIIARAFPDWAMGFKNIENIEVRNIPALNNFLNDSKVLDELAHVSPENFDMLNVFKKAPLEFRKSYLK